MFVQTHDIEVVFTSLLKGQTHQLDKLDHCHILTTLPRPCFFFVGESQI